MACNFLIKQLRREFLCGRTVLEEIAPSTLMNLKFCIKCSPQKSMRRLLRNLSNPLVSDKSVAGARKMQAQRTMAPFQSIISALQLILKKHIA